MNNVNHLASATSYEPPVLRQVGTVEDMTQGNHSGHATDKFFPAGTPRGSITFS